MPNGAHTPLPSETVTLGPEGQIRVPERLRHRLGWQEGDKLVVTADDRKDVKILTVHDAMRAVGVMPSPQAGGRLLADEVIEERDPARRILARIDDAAVELRTVATPAEQAPRSVVGLFADDPELFDEVSEQALQARERHPLRRTDA